MKFGIFYELQIAAPVAARRRAPALPERARPGRTGRQARLRLRLGGRAPFPRGILALAGPRGVPRRRQPADEEHPAVPRHHAIDDDPPGALRRAHRRARPRVERPRRVRHRRKRQHHRAGAVRRRFRREAGDLGGGDPGHHPDVHEGRGRASRQVFPDAAAQRRAEADPEAAPAACGSPARRSRRSRWPDGAASARWRSSSCRPTRRMPGCTPITTPLPSASRSWPIT